MTSQVADAGAPLPQRIGRYEIECEFGREPALVYGARDPLLGRPVVIRTTAPVPSAWDARILNEARAVAKLDHPNVMGVYDFGEQDGKPFIVVEHAGDSRNLAAYFKPGQASQLLVLLRITAVVAGALQYCHERGVIHCDVQPGNVIIAPSGMPMLVDFRLAMEATEEGLPADCPIQSAPSYLEPDAARSRRFTPQSDIWSLGATLFRLLAGQPIWPAKTPEEIVALADRLTEIDLAPIVGEAPLPVVDIVARCLRLNRSERYTSAAELCRALEMTISHLELQLGATATIPPLALGQSILLHAEHHEPGRPGSYREYEIVRLIGSGTFGDVYLANDIRSGAPVALKILKTEWLARPDMVQRFQREATLLSRLSHLNVLRVHTFGRYGRSFFMATDVLTGDTLELAANSDPRPSLRQKLEWCCGLLDGLQAIHDVGIVHRDLKPANVGLMGGCPIIFDFGIARCEDERGLTATGAILGTPQYMSPEQARGTACTSSSDVYSAGVIAYELLTGRLPHQADSVMALLRLKADVPAGSVRGLAPDLPDRIAECLDRMLAHVSAARPSAASAAAAFRSQ